MARNYFNLDEAEIDNILMVNLFPKNRGRVNFSSRETFDNVLMPELIKKDCQTEFIANLINLHRKKKGVERKEKTEDDYELLLEVFLSSPKYLKLAVIITLDELEE